MDRHKNETELAQLFDALFPLAEGEKVPMPRFGRTQPPPAQPLPATGPQNEARAKSPPAPLQWIDDDLGIRVFIECEAEAPAGATGNAVRAVWAYVEGDDPNLAGKSASVALVNEKGDRFLGRLIPLEKGPDNRCTGKLRFGTIDEVRAQLGSDQITLDVFLME
jgi:hypothetical protein